ncbi:MAG TPA: hypothetical protein VHF01_05675 [Candidatus Acidoferrum sp.]|nr:hypothetical protein [Candidatus Acidoferrum sp.]
MRRITAGISLPLALACLGVAQNSGHFDLKGERLGESLESFKKIHPLAHCSKNDPERQVQLGEDGCTVYRGVSFAGLPAVSDADCERMDAKVGDGRNCYEGLHASFRGGKLMLLSYVVSAEGGQEWALQQVISALTEKFGKSENRGWINGAEALTVHGSELPLGQGKEKVSLIEITLSTIEDYSKKDI